MFDVDVEKNQLKKGGERTRTMKKAREKGYSYRKKNIYSTSNSQKVEVAKAKDAERRKNGKKKEQEQEQNSATSSSVSVNTFNQLTEAFNTCRHLQTKCVELFSKSTCQLSNLFRRCF